jgi:membrane associated rhomboid family serine protease
MHSTASFVVVYWFRELMSNALLLLRQRLKRINPFEGKRFFQSSYSPRNDQAFLFGIIGVNTLVFFGWQQEKRDQRIFMRKHFTLSYHGIVNHHRWHTLFTATISHESLGHFLGNMLTLYFFGSTALTVLGIRQFALLYFGGGLMSSVGQLVADYYSYYSKQRNHFLQIQRVHLGASGGVMSVLTWTILSFPTSTIMLYFIIPMPAAFLGVLYIANDLSGLIRGQEGVSYAAHLVGAAYGTATFLFLKYKHKIFRRW